jgi:hypothetical protein
MSEKEIAIREGELACAEEAYFSARQQADCINNRRVFEAGFNRGWDTVKPEFPEGLTDAQIDEIAESMPGGLMGFSTTWGWLQFARAIEQKQGIGIERS